MIRSIVWFKTDLRIHDNETLIKAIAQSDEIIPVYCFDNADFGLNEFGFQKTGNFRTKFLFESLVDLDKQLRQLGSGLLVVKGNPETELINIAKYYQANKLFAKKEVAFNEKQIEKRVEKELWKLKCEVETFSTSTLYHAQDLPFSIKDIPDVFTNFRKKIEKESSIRSVYPSPLSIKSPIIPPIKLPTLEELGLTEPIIDHKSVLPFKGGESEGHKRLDHYFFETKAVSNYKHTRNELVGADYSSKFSVWLALGCLSARGIYDKLKQYEAQCGANESTYWLVFELIWRDYFRFMMKKHGHQFFLPSGIKPVETIVQQHNAELLQKWVHGETGNDFIDANMIELKQTGFMSNRGRQNVASYLCHDLKLDWRYGAVYFQQQLIDYDVSSNWGNWAYLAGVGNDPRGQRYFNIEKQANDYDSKQQFRKLWLTKTI